MRKRQVTSRGRKEMAADLEQNRRAAEHLRKELLSAEAQFIATEIDLGLTFCAVAESASDEQRKRRNTANAKKACEAANHFLTTFHLAEDVREDLAEKLITLEQAVACVDSDRSPSGLSADSSSRSSEEPDKSPSRTNGRQPPIRPGKMLS